MPGDLQVGEGQRDFVSDHLDGSLDLAEGQTAFLGLTADYPGEVITE
jgi:hypothetical protein